MSVDEAHLVAVALGDAGDEVIDVAQSGPNSSRGFPRPEPRLDLELLLAFVVGDQLEVQIEVLEVTGQLAPWALHLYHLRLHLYLHPFRDVHGLRR